jgi:hypothetical protein
MIFGCGFRKETGSKIVFSSSTSNILFENGICGIWMIQQSQNQIK